MNREDVNARARENYSKNGSDRRAKAKLRRDAHLDETRLKGKLRMRKYRAENPGKCAEAARARYAASPTATAKAREKSRRWRARHPEDNRRITSAWREENPVGRAAQTHRRRALKLGATGSFTPEDIAAHMMTQNGRCYFCCKVLTEFHIDHLEALSKGGSNHPNNVRPVCPQCNNSKYTTSPLEFSLRMLVNSDALGG